MTAYVNGQKIDRSGNTAIADTGTTLCLVDKALCDAIYAQVPGSKSFPSSDGLLTLDMTAKLRDTYTPSQSPNHPFLRSRSQSAIPAAQEKKPLTLCLGIWDLRKRPLDGFMAGFRIVDRLWISISLEMCSSRICMRYSSLEMKEVDAIDLGCEEQSVWGCCACTWSVYDDHAYYLYARKGRSTGF